MPQLRSVTRNPARAQNARLTTSEVRPATRRSTRGKIVGPETANLAPTSTAASVNLDTQMEAHLTSNASSNGFTATQSSAIEHAGDSTAIQGPAIDDVGASNVSSGEKTAQAAVHEGLRGGMDQDPAIDDVGIHLIYATSDAAAQGSAAEAPVTLNAGDDSPITACHEDATVTKPAGADLTSNRTAAEAAVTEHAGAKPNTNTFDEDTTMTEPTDSISTSSDGTPTQTAVMEHAGAESNINTSSEDIVMMELRNSTSNSFDGGAAQVAVTALVGVDLNNTDASSDGTSAATELVGADLTNIPLNETTTQVAVTEPAGAGPNTNTLCRSSDADTVMTQPAALTSTSDGTAQIAVTESAGLTNASDGTAELAATDLANSSSDETTIQVTVTKPADDLTKTSPNMTPDSGTSGDGPSTKPDTIIVDLTGLDDDDDAARPSRKSKVQGSLRQARDSHVAWTMIALDRLHDQVLGRACAKSGKRSLDFLEGEKEATDRTITHLKELLMDVETYARMLKESQSLSSVPH